MNAFNDHEDRAILAFRHMSLPKPLPALTRRQNGEYVPFTERMLELRRSREPAGSAVRLAFTLYEGASVGAVVAALFWESGLRTDEDIAARIAEERAELERRLAAVTS